MSTSIVILNTGEKIITDLQEAFSGADDDRKGVCLIMKHPYSLFLSEVDTDDEMDLQVQFSKWCPFSIDTEFKIPYDSVMSIGLPDPTLASAYESKIAKVEELQKTETNFVLQQQEIDDALNQIKENPPEQNG